MNNITGGGCGCAQEYAERWPDLSAADLAGVHGGLCPVRLAVIERRREHTAALLKRRFAYLFPEQ